MASKISGTGLAQFHKSYDELCIRDGHTVYIGHKSGLYIGFTIKSRHILSRDGKDYPPERFIKDGTAWDAEMI
jgi:hypothetical protein